MAEIADFGFRLWKQLPTKGNLVISPYSIWAALTRAALGAGGNTKAQMQEVLGLGTLDQQALATGVASLEHALTGGSLEQDGYTVTVANKLYAQDGYSFVPAYLELMRQLGGVETVDFQAGDIAEICAGVNRWISEATNGLVPEMLSPGLLDRMVRAIIANATYFKGRWLSRFDIKRTLDEMFYLVSGGSVTASLMNQTAEFGYAEADGLQLLSMPFKGEKFSLVVILPRDTDGLLAVEGALATEFAGWNEALRQRKVQVTIPRFKVRWGTAILNPYLLLLGMADAFDVTQADFTQMEPSGYLYISLVAHQAVFEVDEEGGEGAAATVVVSRMKGIMPVAAPPVFHADHPFVFVLVDEQTGTPLFVGRVADPTQKG